MVGGCLAGPVGSGLVGSWERPVGVGPLPGCCCVREGLLAKGFSRKPKTPAGRAGFCTCCGVLGRVARLCRSCWTYCSHASLLGGLLVVLVLVLLVLVLLVLVLLLLLLPGPKGCCSCSWVRLRELAAACVTSSTTSAATSSFDIAVGFLQHDAIELQQIFAQHRHWRMIAALIRAPEVVADPSAW